MEAPVMEKKDVRPNREVQVTVRLTEPNSEVVRFKLPENAPLIEVLREGATRLRRDLLPNSEQPLDRLHNVLKHDEVGPAIENLEQSIEDFIREKKTSHDFAIELVRVFRVNTRWAVAPKEEMSPREILALLGLDFQSYTLYDPGSADPLPLDTPILITRGKAFEAQRDGRYGQCTPRS